MWHRAPDLSRLGLLRMGVPHLKKTSPTPIEATSPDRPRRPSRPNRQEAEAAVRTLLGVGGR